MRTVDGGALEEHYIIKHAELVVEKARNGSPGFILELILDMSNVDQLLEPFMAKVMDENNVPVWQCNECGKISKYITNLKGHIEANHLQGLKFNCLYCEKVFKSRGSLRNHVANFHKNNY